MKNIEHIKSKFRDGRHSEAISACQSLVQAEPGNLGARQLLALMAGMVGDYDLSAQCLGEIVRSHPDDLDALFNLAVCQRERGAFAEARERYQEYTSKSPDNWQGWLNFSECLLQLEEHEAAKQSALKAKALNAMAAPVHAILGDIARHERKLGEALAHYHKANSISPSVDAMVSQARTLSELGKHDEAIGIFNQVIQAVPDQLDAWRGRGEVFQRLGRADEASRDFLKVLSASPADEVALKEACVCLHHLRRWQEAIAICTRALEVNPAMVVAKLGQCWARSQMIPSWHIPMMNEMDRNEAYHAGIRSAVTDDSLVFEIGAGSGLLSILAAKCGASRVVACEVVPSLAEVANRIVKDNGFNKTVSVLPKFSTDIQLGTDLPSQADVLVHEIFSSELLGEGVIPAIEDAKKRLLKPNARIVPGVASVMIALVGGNELANYVYAGNPFGIDLSHFNSVSPKKIPFYREDLNPTLLSQDIEAFRFDFSQTNSFPPEHKIIELMANQNGMCFGVIQWIKLEFDKVSSFENHPSHPKRVSNWQHIVFRFDQPIELHCGMSLKIEAAHDRNALWFDMA